MSADPLSIFWQCPLCTDKIEIPRVPTMQGNVENRAAVDDHMKDHQRYGLVIS